MKQFMLIALMALVSVISAGAQTSEQTTKASASATKSAKTTILQTVVVPDGTPIHTGTTRTGNPKFYVTLTFGGETVDVTVTESLANKYKNGTAKIEIVKRKDNSTGRITYTSRTLGGRQSKPSTDINLSQASFK